MMTYSLFELMLVYCQFQPLRLQRPLGAQSLGLQERLLIEDILSIYLGSEANYIEIREMDSSEKNFDLRRVTFDTDDSIGKNTFTAKIMVAI